MIWNNFNGRKGDLGREIATAQEPAGVLYDKVDEIVLTAAVQEALKDLIVIR